ncbi:MAG: thiamine pyrophosphate-dependent dehydrogenase E1 component subunit alpha [Bradymonadaceae bacterium]
MSISTDQNNSPSPRRRFEDDPRQELEKLYAQMVLIRRFEEHLLDLFETGALVGTTHCYIGQEANAVGIINHLDERDIVFSNHRCHGHFLVYADRPELLAGELMGRATGVVGGRGGSQHICHHGFYSNGIQGGIVPTATGMALAEKVKGTGAVAVVFLGDGTLGQGVVYEALNMASLWSAPILFVVENNRWAQSTPVEKELAGDMASRGRAFGMDAGEIDSTDAEKLYGHFGEIIDKVRRTSRPHFEVIHTYRLCHHSKSDDARPQDEIDRYQKNEPLPKLRARIDENVATGIEDVVRDRVEAAFGWADRQPFPDIGQLGPSVLSSRKR